MCVLDTSSAGRAVIVNRAAAVKATGITRFERAANAVQAAITSSGSSVNAEIGGWTMFAGQSTAGQSTLVAEAAATVAPEPASHSNGCLESIPG